MSVRLITRVFDARIGDHIAKAVLVKLADFANDEGVSWPAIKRISLDTEIPERTVKRKLAWLEAEGFICRRRERTDGGHYGLTFYMLTLPQPEATVAPGTGGHGGPRPEATTRAVARAFPFSQEPSNGNHPPELPPRLQVDRRPVSDPEIDLARSVLATWNAMAGQDLRSVEWIRKIVMRVREYPEMDLDAHAAVIGRVLAGDPWWTGPPSPALIYGNGAVFESALTESPPGAGHTSRPGRRFGRGVTTDDLRQKADELRRQGR